MFPQRRGPYVIRDDGKVRFSAELLLQFLSGAEEVGSMVENLPSNEADTGLIPGRGTKVSHAEGQLSPHTTTTESSL